MSSGCRNRDCGSEQARQNNPSSFTPQRPPIARRRAQTNMSNIDQITAANDIVEVIGSYFPLHARDAVYVAHCPFHDAQTASFLVDPGKQTFACTGCGASGNVAKFVMRYENIDLLRAIQRLAARAGMSVEGAEPALLLQVLLEEHFPGWRRIEITDSKGQMHVFEQ